MSVPAKPEAEAEADQDEVFAASRDNEVAANMARLAQGDEAEAARMLARLSTRMFDEVAAIERIARFELRERLGAGAMGVVYAAWDPQLDRRVAIKLLRDAPGQASDPDSGRRLLREAKAMARLRHPNVVRVLEVGTHEGQVFVAMEIIEGTSLRTWLRERERSWQEIVEVFTRAGQGLAAAHAAGLVHRDFKPDNVLIEGERVFVGDFGLARSQLSSLDPAGSGGPEATAAATKVELDTTLTQTGAFVGTPAYMAPESTSGASPDARADQYGFCASLYEALHRQRPFSQQTLSSLSAAKQEVALAEVESGQSARTPRWLQRVVLRGLSAQPEHRFASMDALLAALARGPRRARWLRRTLLASLVVGTTASLAVLAANTRTRDANAEPSPPPVCTEAMAHTHLDEIWSPARSERIERAFTSSDLAYAGELATRATANLERHARGWVAGWREACEATQLRGEQSAHVLDLRMRCLDRRLSELDALLVRFESPMAKDISQALHAVDALPPVDSCSEIERLESTTPLPEDPATRAAVTDLRGQLDMVRAALSTGQHELVEPLAAGLLEQARSEELGYRPLSAEAALALGTILSRTGKPKEASVMFEQAIIDAQASGHDEVATQAMIGAIHVVGFQLRDVEGGQRYMRQGRALLQHIGDPPRWMASYFRNAGTVEFAAGDYERARDYFQQAIALFTELEGPKHYAVAESRSNLAAVERHLGNAELALELYLQAKGDLEAALGPSHPSLLSVHNNIAVGYMSLERYEEAEATLELAIELAERSFAADHPTRGHPLNNLGELMMRQQRYAEARARYTQAIDSWTLSLGPEHPLLAHPLTGRGAALIELGDPDSALADLERALALRTEHKVPLRSLGETEFLLARALEALGRPPARSRALATLALEHLGEDDGDLVSHAQLVAWLAAHPEEK